MTEKRGERSPEQEQVVQREAIELGETRKGAYFAVEVGLPPGFVPPSAALSPQSAEPATAEPANGHADTQQSSAEEKSRTE